MPRRDGITRQLRQPRRTGKMRRRRTTREKTRQAQARRSFTFGTTSVKHALCRGSYLGSGPKPQPAFVPSHDQIQPEPRPEPKPQPVRESWWSRSRSRW